MGSPNTVSERELLAYLTGALPRERSRELDRRIAEDADLAARFESLERLASGEAASDPDGRQFQDIRRAVATAARGEQFRALRDDIRAGRVVLFVGPGFSQAAGLADWEEVSTTLATKVARRLAADDPAEIERLKHLGLHSLSELFIHHFGRPQFSQALTEALHSRYPMEEQKLDLHEMSLEIPFAAIVSTNWDDLFEQAGRNLDPPIFLNAITTDEELFGLYTPHGPMLIQPRGSLRKGNAAVDRHAALGHAWRHPGLCDFLRTLFFTHRILFVGFGDKDPGLLYYYHLLEAQLGSQAAQVWAQSYVFAPMMTRVGVERLRQMGMRIIECYLPSTSIEGRARASQESVAMECFLQAVLDETRPVVNRLGRSRRIAEFMGETEYLGQDLRGRAGLSPIGLPERTQLAHDDYSAIPPGLSLTAEYDEQERMKHIFLHAIHRTVASGHSVNLILSTDFESLQDRATHKRWAQLQLQNLVEFFESGDGKDEHVRVVDRHGPFEMQQYIFGEGELAESVKLDVHDPTYYYARTSKDPREAKAAARLFDVCFAGLASRNLEDLLAIYENPGRKYLVQKVCDALREGGLEPVLKNAGVRDPLAARLAEELRSTASTGIHDAQVLRANVEGLLTTWPAHVAMSVLSEDVVYQAIKAHLIAQWKHELLTLSETRPGWIIQLTNCNGEPKGELEKDACHRALYGEEESELYNLHVAAFVLTSDARRLILRKRRDDGPYFDPGKWDRTVTGHVKKDSTYSREFCSEVLEHFESGGVRGTTFVTRAQFVEVCQQRATQSSRMGGEKNAGVLHGRDVIAFSLHAEALPNVYRRVRAEDSMPIMESVRSMLYLCIMPRPELPLGDPSGKHFADWVEVPLEEVGRLLSTKSSIHCTTVIAGQCEEIGPTTMTHEAWALLQMCYDEILADLPT